MTILFDENISHRLVELLVRCGAPGDLQHLRKLKWSNTPDLEWMPRAVQAGFAIVTADRNDRTRGLASEDLKLLGARVMLLGPFWDNLTIWDKTKWLVARWDR